MIKKLGKYVKGYWGLAIVTPILVLLESGIEILIPYIMANLIDMGIDKGNMSMISHYGWILLGLALIALITGIAAAVTAPFASAGFATNLRKALYYKVQDFDFESVDKFSPGAIVTRLTTDVSNVQQAFQMLTRICARAPAMVIFSLIAAFSTNAKLACVFLIAVPIIGVGTVIFVTKVRPLFEKIFKTYDKLNNVTQENLHAVRVVKSFNRQEFENKKFIGISETIFKDFSKAEKMMAFVGPIMQFSMYLCIILIAWIGAKMIVASGNNELFGLTTGQLMSMMTYIAQILMSLMMVAMVFVMLVMAKASADRIIEILDEKSNIEDPENPITEVKDGSIVIRDASFRAIENINLEIKSGETVGIIGATGSGKSTIVQLIPRLYDVKEGEVLVGGVNVKDYSIESLRDAVAMVLQKNILFSGTINENLRWGKEDATPEEIRHVCDVACATEFIEKMPDKYETKLEQGGTNVSGGQRQRLCIARALLKSPKILILDDSTSAVDMTTDAKIRNALAGEMPDVTKIIIAQRIASVKDSDKIIVLDDGKIVGIGNHEELMKTSEIYRDVYETQNKLSSVDIDIEGGEA